LEQETQKIRDELEQTNRRIEEYISDVSTQLSSAERWLSEHADETNYPDDEN